MLMHTKYQVSFPFNFHFKLHSANYGHKRMKS